MSTSGGTGGAQRLVRFVASLEAKGIDTNDLSLRMSNPVQFRAPGFGKPAYGYEASILPEICDAVWEADKRGLLRPQQQNFAKQCEILLRALAHVGIIALVDEATGFQAHRDQQALAKFLEAYITKELRKWVKTFPREFFQQLCRLKGIPFPNDMRLPQYFGKVVNDLVYDRLAPGVREELNRVNPVTETGRRRYKHFQYLTEDIGHPKLLHHLGVLIGLAYGFDDGEYDRFYERVARVLPNHQSLPLWLQANAESLGRFPRRAKAGAETD